MPTKLEIPVYTDEQFLQQYQGIRHYFLKHIHHLLTVDSGLEISQNKICGGECDSCKFYLNKNTLLFSIDVIGSYFRPWLCSVTFTYVNKNRNYGFLVKKVTNTV